MTDTDLQQLKDRYFFLLEKYTDLSLDLAKKLEEFGRIRKELQYIVAEFAKNNQEAPDPKHLQDKIEQFLSESKDAQKEDK